MSEYKICTKTIMDTTDPDISFDENGVSNHFYNHQKKTNEFNSKRDSIEVIINKIKKSSKGQYDCLIGISGGVDSTYVAFLCKKYNLNPLAVHVDNGWNSELAIKNIEKVLDKLNIDLYTHVVDWDQFKNLQLAFLKASVPDGEVPTDHVIISTLYKKAKEFNIKYIIDGTNLQTESILPKKWGYGYYDLKYIKSINKKFGQKKIDLIPKMNLMKFFFYTKVIKIESISILNYINYNKEKAMDLLINELGWKYYGGKHYESIYTRFFQSYILPKKFNIDKRKAHLSNLICSKQLSRDSAMKLMKEPTYPNELSINDKDYVIKKLEITDSEFEEIMNEKPKNYEFYPNNDIFFKKLRLLKKILNVNGI